MIKRNRFWFGFWIGTHIVAYLAALDLIYLMTGKLALPSKAGAELVDVEEAAGRLNGFIDKLEEGCCE